MKKLPKILIGILGGLAVAVMLPPPPSLAQPARPILAVEVVIDSESYATNLGSELAVIEDRLESTLATQAGSQLAFLDWRPAHQDVAAASGSLRFRIVEESQPELGGLLRFLVQYEAVDGEGLLLRLDPPLETVLFSGFEEGFSTADGPRLQARAEALIAEHFGDTGFTDGLKNDFLFKKIRLSDDLFVEPPNQQIVVPLRLADLRASQESVFRVEFTAPGQGDEDLTGQVFLKARSSINSGERAGFVVGFIELFDFPPDMFEPQKYWHPDVADRLATRRETHVYMASYDKVLDGLTTPEPGDDGAAPDAGLVVDF